VRAGLGFPRREWRRAIDPGGGDSGSGESSFDLPFSETRLSSSSLRDGTARVRLLPPRRAPAPSHRRSSLTRRVRLIMLQVGAGAGARRGSRGGA